MIHFLLGQKAYFANANCWFQGVYSKGLSSRKRSFTIFLFVAKTSRVENRCISTISFLSFRVIFHETIILGERGTPPKFNSSPLKNGGWKTFASPIGVGNLFRGELLIFGRVLPSLKLTASSALKIGRANAPKGKACPSSNNPWLQVQTLSFRECN